MKWIISLSIALMLVPTTLAFATSHTRPQTGANAPQTGASAPISLPAQTLDNPLRGANSLGELFQTLAQFAVDLSYVVIAIFLLISGFKFVKAQGNPEELAGAKRTFWYTIIGALIIIGVEQLVGVFKSIINQLR